VWPSVLTLQYAVIKNETPRTKVPLRTPRPDEGALHPGGSEKAMSRLSVQHRTLSCNGIRLRVTEAGPVDGSQDKPAKSRCLLLVHGWPESWYSWRYQIPALVAAGYRVIVPDMRGFGGSDSPAEIASYNVLNLVDDMTGVLQACDIEQATVIGHDWGAAVAWHCALIKPDRFPAVAALSVPHLGRPPAAPTQIWKERFGDQFYYILYHQQPGVAEAEYEANPTGLLRMLFASPDTPRYAPVITDRHRNAGGWIGRIGDTKELPEWLSQQDLDYYLAEFKRAGFRGGLNYYRNFDRNWELTRDLDQEVKVPAMFIAGSQDLTISHMTSENLKQRLVSVVPDLRGFHWIEGAGHWIQQEKSEACNVALIEFLAEL
jgi:pimeloyl-ACP methyl ester carboxylesterase